MTSEGKTGENPQAPATPTAAEPPEVGAVLATIYGPQRVTDILDMPFDKPTVFLRPERGGAEWTVTVAELPTVHGHGGRSGDPGRFRCV